MDDNNLKPKEMLQKFTTCHGGQVFYYEDIARWVQQEFGIRRSMLIISDILNLEGIVELGDSAYQAPL